MCEILPFWKNEDTKELVTAEYSTAVMTWWEPGPGARGQGPGGKGMAVRTLGGTGLREECLSFLFKYFY